MHLFTWHAYIAYQATNLERIRLTVLKIDDQETDFTHHEFVIASSVKFLVQDEMRADRPDKRLSAKKQKLYISYKCALWLILNMVRNRYRDALLFVIVL